MNCRQAQRLITSYVKNKLTGKELEEFLLHVEACPDCYDELEIYYSIYHALNQMEDAAGGEYDFRKALNQQLLRSERSVRSRKFSRVVYLVMVFLAEVVLVMSLAAKLGITIEYSLDNETEYQSEYVSEYPSEAQTEDQTEGADR